jgi:hypothetical protein
MSKEFCPECENPLHRSHSRSLHEKLIRTFSRFKLYRCHKCDWRGWLAPGKKKDVVPTAKKLFPLTLTFAVALLITLLAIYFAGS